MPLSQASTAFSNSSTPRRVEQPWAWIKLDIEHYHRIRNTLYHNGTGLSVDEQYLLAYRQIAAIIAIRRRSGAKCGSAARARSMNSRTAP